MDSKSSQESSDSDILNKIIRIFLLKMSFDSVRSLVGISFHSFAPQFCLCIIIAKPMKTLEFHDSMIQFLICQPDFKIRQSLNVGHGFICTLCSIIHVCVAYYFAQEKFCLFSDFLFCFLYSYTCQRVFDVSTICLRIKFLLINRGELIGCTGLSLTGVTCNICYG